MAGIKISDLPPVVTPDLTDVFPIDQGAVTYKESASQLLSLFQLNGQALTRTNDTNVTMTLGGSPNTALLNAASMTLGWAGQLAVPRGGTGNSTFTAYSVICAGTTATGAFQNVVGLGNAGEQLTSNGAGLLPTWQAGTTSPLTTKGDLYTFTTVNARLPVGTINGQYLQVNSGTATGLAWSTATLPSTALNAARILRSDGTNYVDTTSTFADTYAASGFLYANGANNVAGLATANNGVPVTSNTGVPSILAGPGTTGNFLQSNAAAAPSWSTATFPSVGGTAGNILISNGTNYIASTSLWPNTVGTAGKLLQSDGTTNGYSTPTWPTTGGTSGSIVISDGTNKINSTSLWPNTVGTSGKIVISDGTSNVYSTPTYPNAATSTGSFLYANGTNWVASTSLWPNTVGTAGKLLRSDGTINAYTTSTYPDTNAVNTLLYASSANVMAALATANNGILVTSSGGVPSISSTLPNAVLANITKPTVQSFTSGTAQTYTTPANCLWIKVRIWGGGGGGGGAATAAVSGGAGGGGGAGGYSELIITSPAATYTYTVGAAANGGSAGFNAGTAGNASSFSTLTANGGGAGGAGGTGTTTISSFGGGGGSASGGTINITGGYGGAGVIIGVTGIAGYGGGAAAGTSVGISTTTGAGVAGNAPGAGGSGGSSSNNSGNAAGGNGSAGLIVVEEFYS